MQKIVATILITILSVHYCSASDETDLPKGPRNISFNGLYYLTYSAGQKGNSAAADMFSQFAINRGYFTVNKIHTSILSSRWTMDVTQDSTGDLKVRLKYGYAKVFLPEWKFFTEPNVEFGLAHTPWLDFEEHINRYRMRGTMFMERNKLFNSADFGVTLAGLLGGQLPEDYRKTVNDKYAGRYGSFALGFYNGGGYHAPEQNLNHPVWVRVTLRPVPDKIPGFQVSALNITGQGNKSSAVPIPDWNTTAGMLSYESAMFTITAQYVFGSGNQGGSWADTIDYYGYSVFIEGKYDSWRIIGNYDSFDPDKDIDNNLKTRYIAGLGYILNDKNIVILDYDLETYENSALADTREVKLTLQVSF